jgi:hypothetical protein
MVTSKKKCHFKFEIWYRRLSHRIPIVNSHRPNKPHAHDEPSSPGHIFGRGDNEFDPR